MSKQRYLVEWNDDPDYAYYADLTPDEKKLLTEKMGAADGIETFTIKEHFENSNDFDDMLVVLEDWGVE